MKKFLAVVTGALLTQFANALPITFNATGSVDVSGYVTFDDSLLIDGFVSNSAITDLSLTAFGITFSLGDVDTSASTIFDLSGLEPVIDNGAGALASAGGYTIAFFPDGFGGSAYDGDASLAFDSDGSFSFGGSGWDSFTAVKWEVASTDVPEPTTLSLLGLGLAGAGFLRRKQAVKK